MTTVTPLPTRTPVTDAPARFRDLLAAEWIKLWSLRSTRWTLPLVFLFVVGVSVHASLADYRNWPRYPAGTRELFHLYGPARDAFPEAGYLLLMLAAASVGALTLVGEYQSGLIRATFAAVPARRSVVAAKAAVLTAVMLVLGLVTAATAFWVSQAILSGRDAGWSIGDPGVARAVLGSALLVPVCALIGMGLGAVIRHAAGAVVAATAVLVLLPLMVDSDKHRWIAELRHALPVPAWQRLIEVHPDVLNPDPFPATVTGAWLGFAGWSLAATLVAVAVVHRRDP
ncbi:ABC-2 family transporter protein [Micromonospora echinaurantiaca]|uniref:ABC-2 family transporter protein n=1 Tax=Micromonospora echinaurantiaca TaxID=47857 RepID=A0A1C5H6T1_9ACTN|nr:ABC transporter permease subunit [Micromonospora echinaurantiaca]SCG41742.1 ABC-2 family transporter protein [Micromonospora echinaurantiaca]